jgi:hypothetical protein
MAMEFSFRFAKENPQIKWSMFQKSSEIPTVDDDFLCFVLRKKMAFLFFVLNFLVIEGRRPRL